MGDPYLDLNEDNAKAAVESLGGDSSYIIANVTEEESVQNAIDETVKKFGEINIVVNCAGIGSASKSVGRDGAHPLDYFKTVVDINLNGICPVKTPPLRFSDTIIIRKSLEFVFLAKYSE